MNYNKFLSRVIIIATSLFLAACSSNQSTISNSSSAPTTTPSTKSLDDKEQIEKDTMVLLKSIYSTDETGFPELYDATFDVWIESIFNEFNQSQLQDIFNLGKTEEDFTFTYPNGEILTPTEVNRAWFESRTNAYKKMSDGFSITKIELSDYTIDNYEAMASVWIKTKDISSIYNDIYKDLLAKLFPDGIFTLRSYSLDESEEADIAKILMQRYIDNIVLNEYFDKIQYTIDNNFPFSEDETKGFGVMMYKNKEGNWLIDKRYLSRLY